MKLYVWRPTGHGELTRAECECGKFADVLPDSVMLTKRIEIGKRGFKRRAYAWDNVISFAGPDSNACSDCMWRNYKGSPKATEVEQFCNRTSLVDFRLVIEEGHLYVLCTKKKYDVSKQVKA